MIRSLLLKFILKISTFFKPLLIKILPIEYLRKAKMKIADPGLIFEQFDRKPFDPEKYPDGINLIGYIKGEIGLGQSCRLIADALQECKFDFSIYNYKQVSSIRSNDDSWEHKISKKLPYNINLIHINPYEIQLAIQILNKNVWDYKYNIAFWLWELEIFPKEWEQSLKLMDEIWVPSEFAAIGLRKVTNLPINVIPYPINVASNDDFNRSYFGLPNDKFLFLVMYDCNSTIERKNPVSAINAYKNTFKNKDKSVGIVIKINNPQKIDINIINESLSGYENVFIFANIMDKIQVNSLIKNVDVYVSLHRSEGFGLVLAEAMYLGTPTIATNWSSNTEFMNSNNACLVNYKFTNIENDVAHYKCGNRWAEPDIFDASSYMLKLKNEPEFYKEIARNAEFYIKNTLNLANAADLINNRMDKIYQQDNYKVTKVLNIQKNSESYRKRFAKRNPKEQYKE